MLIKSKGVERVADHRDLLVKAYIALYPTAETCQ